MNVRDLPLGNIPINVGALKAEIKRRGLSHGAMSSEIGRASNYLATCFTAENINKQTIILLESMYGIKPETYVAVETETQNGGAVTQDYSKELRDLHIAIEQAKGKIENVFSAVIACRAEIRELKAMWSDESEDKNNG